MQCLNSLLLQFMLANSLVAKISKLVDIQGNRSEHCLYMANELSRGGQNGGFL
jgi:hypothetical protein